MNAADAISLLRKYHLPDDRIRHCEAVGHFAFRLAQAIGARHPELQVSAEKVRIGGILHDIGRARHGDHETNSVAILRAEGLPEYANIVMHGSLYEMMQIRGEERPELLPSGLENKIVAYADARVRFEPLPLQKRIDEIIHRRRDERIKVRSMELAAPRYFALERELVALAGEQWEEESLSRLGENRKTSE